MLASVDSNRRAGQHRHLYFLTVSPSFLLLIIHLYTLPMLMNTTEPPTHSPSGSSADGLGYHHPPPSASLKLQQVHYIVRHGERTPVRTRQIKGIPNRWNFCKSGRQFSAAVLDVTGHGIPSQGRMNVERRVEGSDHNDQVVKGQDGECLLGELTDVGRASTLRIGKELRSLYIDQLGLLPQKLLPSDENKVYFRSTNMSRTVESLQQIVRGLLPQTQIDGDQFVPKILIRNGTNENLLPNTFGCARLRNLDRAFADFAAKIHNPSLEPLDSKLAPICGGAVPRVDGHPRLNGILDTVKAASAHGIKVDPVFTEPQIAETLEKAVCAEWFSGYQAEDPEKRLEFRRLAMGRLLEDLNTRLTTKARFEETDPLRLAVYSAHDTSLAGLLSTLDCFDNRWPSFTASVGIELWKDTRPEAQPSILDKFGYMLGISSAETPHYVRMRYGDKTLRLPACSKPGRHLEGNQEFCTLDAFREIVHGLRHPKGLNWEQQCDVGRGEKSSKFYGHQSHGLLLNR